jgi:menaquinone-dependent protoporphyrinogen IX oxidase
VKTGKKTLIVYESKGGVTKLAAEIIAEVLRYTNKFEVDLVDLRKTTPKLAEYDNVIVGAGVRGGKVYSEALKFLKLDFGERKIAFFVCCGGAGDPKNYEDACKKYLTNVLANYPDLKVISSEAFGGRMKVIGRTVFDNFKPEKIREWTEKLNL